MLVLFVCSVVVALVCGDLHYAPKLVQQTDGSIVKIKIMKMGDCEEAPIDTVFCSNRELSEIRNTAAVICRSVMDHFYTTGDAVQKAMTKKQAGQVEEIGHDFWCSGSENNLDQCRSETVVCNHRILVTCSGVGIAGLCKSSCGCMAPTLLAKVIGGEEALPGEFPWQVRLRVDRYICGGTIISARHILTAAHCFHNPGGSSVPCTAVPGRGSNLKECKWLQFLSVYYGTEQYQRNENTQAAVVDKVIIHQDYVRGLTALLHDVAIIVLRDPIFLTPYVQPACLPSKYFVLPENSNVTVSGFGDTTRRSAIFPDVLKKASVKWQEVEPCNKTMFSLLSQEHLCAGDISGSNDACRGDSGGPLVYKDDKGIATVVGVVSFSYGCAVAGLWSVYADVRKEMEFINNVMDGVFHPDSVVLSCNRGRCRKQ